MRLVYKGKPIITVADLQKFCTEALEHIDAACGDAMSDPSVVYLDEPLELWAVERTLSDGSHVYDITCKLAQE